ncbi:alpha-(1,3)-fucosyltransferase C-like [Cydia splendana]|uniref:alpha-(1,3)-fucosyltransferase C-like n=1 Tax=Cydia splendana TaxID=1100963 RepID=UPI00300C141C
MAVATYCFKAIKRIGLFMVIVLVTTLALFLIDQEEEDDFYEVTTKGKTEMYKRTNYNTKYILLWTDSRASPFNYLGRGSYTFREKSCKYTNCFVTGNRQELGDISLFDVVLFNGPQLTKILKMDDLPNSRSPSQKYVYANIESAQNYPLCNFNGFFNLTWTYRLDSDINWGYFVVKNKTGHVVAPKMDATWEKLENMEGVSKKFKKTLRNKTKAVAWFATNCHTKSRREYIVEEVRNYLKNYSLSVDIYGVCGTLQCPSFINERCLRLLEEEYYFYFAFEKSFSKDYVTEKVLTAYKHNTVPVVYGGADYSRFLPPGSYLNARELGPAKLAETIAYLVKHPEEYYSYFRWQNHYSFESRHSNPETDDYCKFCAVLNENEYQHYAAHGDLKQWWNGNYSCDQTKH